MSATLHPVPTSPFACIPAELRQRAQWVCHKGKIPINPRDGSFASVTNPSTWATFDEACTAASAYSGIGFVLSADDPYSIIDIDATDDPAIRARQAKIYAEFDSYSERSTSGLGLHIIVRGNVPEGRRRDKVEVYPRDRFFVMTGDVTHDVPIAERQELLSQLWHEMAPPSQPAMDASALYADATKTDDAIVQAACSAANGDKFVRLWSGDGSAMTGGDTSGSAIDQALVNILAYYSRDPAQIERLWRASPHGQSRTAKLSRAAYVRATIEKSFDRTLPVGNFEGLTAGNSRWVEGVGVVQAAHPAPLPLASWPYPSGIGDDEWLTSSSSPSAIIVALIYADVGTIIAAGGTGKTTFALWLAIHVALGLGFLRSQSHAPRPGHRTHRRR